MAAGVRAFILFLSVLLFCTPLRCGEEFGAVLRRAAGDHRPVLLLVRNPRNVATLDAAHWLREVSDPSDVHVATHWNDEEGLKGFPGFRDGGLFLLNAQGRLIAQIPIPDLRGQLKGQIDRALADLQPMDDLVARAEVGPAGDETVRRAWQRLVDAGRADRAARLLAQPAYGALAQKLSTEVDLPLRERLQQLRAALAAPGTSAESGHVLMRAMLREQTDETTALRSVGLLTEAVLQWGGKDEIKLLHKKIERDSPRGRAVARAALRAGERVAGGWGSSQAKDWWKLAERASENGESPMLHRAAMRQRLAAEGKDSPLRSRWRKREVLDVVVLVSDEASFLEAVSRWNERTYFPVLFQDDLCAPRFIAEFRPARVIVLPPVVGVPPARADELLRVLSSSWGKADGSKQWPAQVDRAMLVEQLRGFSDDPQGVVFSQASADERFGALVLAAGRFQGLEFLSEASEAETVTLSAARVRQLSRQVQEGLASWGLPREGRACYVTMAGDFPLKYLDAEGAALAVDDWVGRGEDGGRLAFTGRLTNGLVASTYMAACSLFLEPAWAVLAGGEEPGDSDDDLAAAARAMGRLPAVTERAAWEPNASSGLAHRTWSGGGFLFVRTAGREWVADDAPAGGPSAIIFTQPGAADDLGHLETLCGRALLSGAFWCGGCVDDGGPRAWPLPVGWATSLRNGAAWGAAFRRDDGQPLGWPWRVVLCGDPLFCLRDEPARRRAYRDQDGPLVKAGETPLQRIEANTGVSPEDWRKRLQEARWRGDREAEEALVAQAPAVLDGGALAMVLEVQLRSGMTRAFAQDDPNPAGAAIEVWRRWSRAEDDARRNPLAILYARRAACALMGSATAAGSLDNALFAFDAFLLTGPSLDSTACWLQRMLHTSKVLDRLPAFSRWLAQRATDADLAAYHKPFHDCARRIGQESLGNGMDGH